MIREIKAEHQRKVNDLMTECLVFWAFSNEQFAANKTPLVEGEKYVSIGGGGYLPKGQFEKLKKGLADADKWKREQIKLHKLRKQNIAYELANHEAQHTGDITDTLQALGGDYSETEVKEVLQTME